MEKTVDYYMGLPYTVKLKEGSFGYVASIEELPGPTTSRPARPSRRRDLECGAGATHFPGTAVLRNGHVVECRIEGLRVLSNLVKEWDAAPYPVASAMSRTGLGA